MEAAKANKDLPSDDNTSSNVVPDADDEESSLKSSGGGGVVEAKIEDSSDHDDEDSLEASGKFSGSPVESRMNKDPPKPERIPPKASVPPYWKSVVSPEPEKPKEPPYWKSVVSPEPEKPKEGTYWKSVVSPEDGLLIVEEIPGDGENFEKIPRMEAICIFCNRFVQEEDSVLKTKCRCKLRLLHEKCYTGNPANKLKEDKCDVCSEISKCVLVTLSRSDGPGSASVVTSKPSKPYERSNKWYSKFTFASHEK